MAIRSVIGRLLLSAGVVAFGTGAGAQGPTPVSVFKSATCGCCAKWVEHLHANGFAPAAANVENLDAVKTKYNVPKAVQSCHTAVVAGYVIEGHVPASDIRRLLKERPAIRGLAVGGMPSGSPGMEGAAPQRYDVMSFDKQGNTRVYATHGN
jgi:hypothetical protein